jgi:hypothetical protein
MEHTPPASLSGSICLDKIDDRYITVSNGKRYLSLRFKHTPDNQYGNDYMISQDVDKATREECKRTGDWPKTEILGNMRIWETRSSAAPPQSQPTTTHTPTDDKGLPF